MKKRPASTELDSDDEKLVDPTLWFDGLTQKNARNPSNTSIGFLSDGYDLVRVTHLKGKLWISTGVSIPQFKCAYFAEEARYLSEMGALAVFGSSHHCYQYADRIANTAAGNTTSPTKRVRSESSDILADSKRAKTEEIRPSPSDGNIPPASSFNPISDQALFFRLAPLIPPAHWIVYSTLKSRGFITYRHKIPLLPLSTYTYSHFSPSSISGAEIAMDDCNRSYAKQCSILWKAAPCIPVFDLYIRNKAMSKKSPGMPTYNVWIQT